ncbi:hypothetical protein OPV22_003465 [Ensete ventricosum]|uniref:Uncharacterized protein n=1 Tax=Ensete ventricosum TaxID=4639 RepID=A0AAV8S0U1_ENSVE|nr:hypothetical protein OPV22_003465 [Ensete ventricosum]
MLVTRPATVQSVSRGAPPRSLIVHGGKVSRSLLPSAVCTIIGGVKVCDPPSLGRKTPNSGKPTLPTRGGAKQTAAAAAAAELWLRSVHKETHESVSQGAPLSLMVNGVEVIHPNRDPSGCHIVNGQKVCDPPIPGRSREP